MLGKPPERLHVSKKSKKHSVFLDFLNFQGFVEASGKAPFQKKIKKHSVFFVFFLNFQG